VFKKVYKKWIAFGDIMGHYISSFILAILFFILFTPISFILKIFNIDLLNKKLDNSSTSYWVDREEEPSSMKYQF